jgi:hypothetical protein
MLINKIEQSLRKNPRSVPLLDMVLMILVIAYGIMKIIRSRYGIFNEKAMYKDQLHERNRKKKNHNTQCLMRLLKRKVQRYQEIKMHNNRSNRYLKLLQVLLEYLPG